MKASIYFNSLTSRIDETQLEHMQDTFADYLASPAFYDQDRYSELKFGSNLNPDEACDNQCPGSCYWSWQQGDYDETARSRCRYVDLRYGSAVNPDEACDNRCPGRCHWSWYAGEFEETQMPRCKLN